MATRDRGLSNDSLSQALGFNFRRGAAAPEAPAARPGGAARERHGASVRRRTGRLGAVTAPIPRRATDFLTGHIRMD